MNDKPKINIGLDDDLPAVPRIKREIDRAALREVSAGHGFDRPVSKTAPVAASSPASARPMLDGRSLRATGRTAQMNAKVLPQVRDAYYELAKEIGDKSIGQLIEEGLELLKAKYQRG